MSNINPYRLNIHDIISYLDSLTLKEEANLLIAKRSNESDQIVRCQRNTRIAQLLLKLAKESAIVRKPNMLLSLLNELPE